MQNKKLVILIVLSAIAVFTLIHGITTTPRGKRRYSARLTPGQDERDRSAEIIQDKRQKKKSRYASLGRNPFMPKGTKATGFRRLILNGIVLDEDGYKAIINDTIVGIGDKVNKNTVVDIRKDSVVLSDGVDNFELRLSE